VCVALCIPFCEAIEAFTSRTRVSTMEPPIQPNRSSLEMLPCIKSHPWRHLIPLNPLTRSLFWGDDFGKYKMGGDRVAKGIYIRFRIQLRLMQGAVGSMLFIPWTTSPPPIDRPQPPPEAELGLCTAQRLHKSKMHPLRPSIKHATISETPQAWQTTRSRKPRR
jgi:hypothetical protein